MINAVIVGLGTWGQVLVNSIQGKSDKIKIVAGNTRSSGNKAEGNPGRATGRPAGWTTWTDARPNGGIGQGIADGAG